MARESSSSPTGRRNRVIVIAAGAITVIAITLALASGYLGLTWLWLRPAAELLLLAELVGLIVLERHQLFEPVHEAVGDIATDLFMLREELKELDQRLAFSGQTSVYLNSSQVLGAVVRTVREALAREQEAPQLLRYARLGSLGRRSNNPELDREYQELEKALQDFRLRPDSHPGSRARLWSVRAVLTMTDTENFDSWRASVLPRYFDIVPLNVEIKLLLGRRSRLEAQLTPNVVSDRDVVIVLEDDKEAFRWGMVLKGPQYVAVFARWFDELYSSIPNDYLVASRVGVNEKRLDQIRKELEAAEASSERRTA